MSQKSLIDSRVIKLQLTILVGLEKVTGNSYAMITVWGKGLCLGFLLFYGCNVERNWSQKIDCRDGE